MPLFGQTRRGKPAEPAEEPRVIEPDTRFTPHSAVAAGTALDIEDLDWSYDFDTPLDFLSDLNKVPEPTFITDLGFNGNGQYGPQPTGGELPGTVSDVSVQGVRRAGSGASVLAIGYRSGNQKGIADPTLTKRIEENLNQMAGFFGTRVMSRCRAVGQSKIKNSDHFWCGAGDIAARNNLGDRIRAWALQYVGPGSSYPFKYVLWRVPDHFDHVHISYNEDYTGPLPRPR